MSETAPSPPIRAENREPIRSVLFDLDGTLADTAPDLAYALNGVLHSQGLPPIPFEQIRPLVSHGGAALIKLGFNLSPGDPDFATRRQQLLAIYQENLSRHTRLFPGMGDVLQALEHAGIAWGVVTNKPSWLTEPLMTQLGLDERAACIISGDTTDNSKPHPEPILHACKHTGCKPSNCLYVGDAERDISAGKSAGTHTLIALFGYIGSDEEPEKWGADGLISHPRDVINWLRLSQ